MLSDWIWTLLQQFLNCANEPLSEKVWEVGFLSTPSALSPEGMGSQLRTVPLFATVLTKSTYSSPADHQSLAVKGCVLWAAATKARAPEVHTGSFQEERVTWSRAEGGLDLAPRSQKRIAGTQPLCVC